MSPKSNSRAKGTAANGAAGPRLRIGLPKGSLQETTIKLLGLAGWRVRVPERSYYPAIDDPEIECILIRAQEMARYVEHGAMDCGITGIDWVMETRAKVKEVADLVAPWPNYRTVRWLLAVKDSSPYRTVKDLEGKRIATEVLGLTKRYLKEHGVSAEVEFSYGATEVKPPLLADAIVDVSETGSSIRANQLRVLDTVLESTPRFIANRTSWDDPWKRRKMEQIALLLRGAIAALDRVGLMMNVRRDRLDAILGLLPALGTPTVSPLADGRSVALNTIVAEHVVRTLIPQLRDAGASGIVEYPLNKII
jgi:ATP phosphoribosyltransferase